MATAAIVHETAGRIRFRLAAADDPTQARVALETSPGVRAVRWAAAARSLTVTYDGRTATRAAIADRMAPLPPRAAAAELPRRDEAALPVAAPLLAAALAPLLPPPARAAVALALVAAKGARAWTRGDDPTAATLDALALAATALTGHPLTATASLLLGALAEQQRNALLRETDRLLLNLVPVVAHALQIERAGRTQRIAVAALAPGDRVRLAAGDVVPADGIVIEGDAQAYEASGPAAAAARPAGYGTRLDAGTRIVSGRIALRVERSAACSRSARLHDHVRHVLRTRDAPGPLTPDLERLVALPVTAAGLMLTLTGDAARTAAMLQADPQTGIALAQPVAREAALYATARAGALLTGLDSLEKLATATTFAFEDVGVLAAPFWHVERVETVGDVSPALVLERLAALAGFDDAALLDAGLPDDVLAGWRLHGALFHDGDRILHAGGAALLARTWGIALREPDRRSLVRRLGMVDNGRLLATVHFGCRLHAGVRAAFAQLRALGVRRIAVFTEDPTAQPAAVLTRLGADEVVSEDRSAQERWLDRAVERGERVALVHTGLRDLLPPGGLSLCPVAAEAGAHGVLLGEPLPSLLAARRAALDLRRALRGRFGRSVLVNSGLMVAAAKRWLPPMAAASAKHALAFLLLAQSARLARTEVCGPASEGEQAVPEAQTETA
jgi:cation transport ATPase